MKTVIREIVAMTILVAAIILVTVTFFFDYIKDQANQPQSAVYKMSEEENTILHERQNYINSQNKIVLSSAYSIDSSDLQSYKVTNQLKTGQSNPFDEVPITDIIYDAEGNAYYQVTSTTQTSNKTSGAVVRESVAGTTENNQAPSQNTNTNNSTYQPDTDITAPSTTSGNLTKGNGGK